MIEFETPAGIGIRYRPESEGKRTYWLSDPEDNEPHWYEVPSVSTVLNILDKPALPWWGMQQGVAGTLSLLERALLVPEPVANRWVLVDPNMDDARAVSRDDVIELLKQEKLTVNDVRDKAGDRGNAAHAALEAWAVTGARAEPAGYPEDQAGYVEAVLKFCADAQLSNVTAEVMVGSVKYGFAGRYDLRGRLSGDLWTGLRNKDARETFDDVSTLLDLKTSKYISPSHFWQAEAYEGASVECGHEPTEKRVIIHARPDGRYVVKTSNKAYRDFLVLRSAYSVVSAK